jgi:hypothetical protein
MKKSKPGNFRLWAIRVPPYYIEKLKLLKEKTDMSVSEHIRIALREYFIKQGIG